MPILIRPIFRGKSRILMNLTGFKWSFFFGELHWQWLTFFFCYCLPLFALSDTFNKSRVFLVIISKGIYWSIVIQYWYNVIFWIKTKLYFSCSPKIIRKKKRIEPKQLRSLLWPYEIDAAISMGLSVSAHANWLK